MPLPFYCNIRQIVGLFSFLIKKLQSSQDYSTSDRRKLDMNNNNNNNNNNKFKYYRYKNTKPYEKVSHCP